jgi:hypothetical protein
MVNSMIKVFPRLMKSVHHRVRKSSPLDPILASIQFASSQSMSVLILSSHLRLCSVSGLFSFVKGKGKVVPVLN